MILNALLPIIFLLQPDVEAIARCQVKQERLLECLPNH